LLPKRAQIKIKIVGGVSSIITGKINIPIYHDWYYLRWWGIHATRWKL